MFVGLFLVVFGASSALLAPYIEIYDLEEAERHFEEFIVKFDRKYESEEERAMRFDIFNNTLSLINKRNALRTEDHHAYHGITNSADFTKEEVQRLTGGLPYNEDIEMMEFIAPVDDAPLPEEFNWVNLNKVTSVKKQGDCGSCWAFSGIANIESQYAIVHNELIDLSEQQIVDCNAGISCKGGSQDQTYRIAEQLGGVELLSDYPSSVTGSQGQCQFVKSKARVIVTNHNIYTIADEVKTLKSLIYNNGPVTVSLYADHAWQSNIGGIITECVTTEPDTLHEVLLVGYGVENGVLYWIIKNSWGVLHGQDGYYRLMAGADMCGITRFGASSAIVA